jgi:hypothetical protein
LTFASSVTHVINDINLNGQASNTRVVLAPGTGSTAYTWNVSAVAQTSVSCVSVSYCDASAGNTILAKNGTSLDGGHNVNWNFKKISSSGDIGVSTNSGFLNFLQ